MQPRLRIAVECHCLDSNICYVYFLQPTKPCESKYNRTGMNLNIYTRSSNTEVYFPVQNTKPEKIVCLWNCLSRLFYYVSASLDGASDKEEANWWRPASGNNIQYWVPGVLRWWVYDQWSWGTKVGTKRKFVNSWFKK